MEFFAKIFKILQPNKFFKKELKTYFFNEAFRDLKQANQNFTRNYFT